VNKDPIFKFILDEQHQSPETRKTLFESIEIELNKPAIAFYTSFNANNAFIEDEDANLIENILQTMDLTKGLALIISSPGGLGLSAERIIKICRSYSGKGKYSAIVPGKAKSAATMICFGASEIYMSPTSELGPIDPQIRAPEGGILQSMSACTYVDSYDKLFNDAKECTGNLEPFLQQLNKYDEAQVNTLRNEIVAAKQIAIQYLKSGMMPEKTEENIERNVEIFLTPAHTKTHGKPIYREEAESCGLIINKMSFGDEVWKLLYELHFRLNSRS